MPNWKKVVVSGSDASLNRLTVTTSITASGAIHSFSSVSASSGLYGRDLFLGPTARFNHTTGGQFLFQNDINASSVEIRHLIY